MARKYSFSVYDRKHLKNLLARAKQIDDLFDQAAREGCRIGEGTGFKDGEFFFDNYPTAKKRIEELLAGLHKGLLTTMTEGDREEWLLSAAKNDAMVDSLFGARAKYGAVAEKWKEPNLKALDKFIKRKEQGMNLSDRVWKITGQFKGELELALELGLGEGKSAADLSRDVRQYLREPSKLFRRVRNEKGQLRLSKAAQAYHPGQGVYRSSYKNALRLTATENNMAYRTADYERWQTMDFVIGIQIKLSNNHTLNGRPFMDICDTLQGTYPKTFKFVGWHPFCRCIAVPKLADEDEFIAQQQALIDGRESDVQFSGVVTDMPGNFVTWMQENEERISAASTEPYFIRDNRKQIADALRASTRTISIPRNETLEQMAQRLGDNMPPTLKSLQSKIDDSNKRVRFSSAEIKKHEELLKERLRQLLDSGDFGMNIPLTDSHGNNVVEAIFDSHFKSQIETGTGKGWVDIDGRKEASAALFGTNEKVARPEQFEKYGFLMSKDILAQVRSGIADQYWAYGDGLQVRFRKDKVTATFTCGDSLGMSYRPSLTTDPQICSLDKVRLQGSGMTNKTAPAVVSDPIEASNKIAYRYIELQYHGMLTPDCIESIFIPEEVVPKITPALLKKMRATGAKLYSAKGGQLITL